MFSSVVDRNFYVNLVRLAAEAARADGSTLYTLDESGRFLKPFAVTTCLMLTSKLSESWKSGRNAAGVL